VGELRNLFLNGANDFIVGVPDRDHTDARTKVGELVAINVNQGGSVGSVDVDRKGRSNTVRNLFEALGMEFLGLRPWNGGYDFAL
jgi:hypothetical protein